MRTPGQTAGEAHAPAFVFRLVPTPFHHGALGVVRSLGRMGVPVYANHRGSWEPIRRSRFAAGGPVWRDWPASSGEAVERLLAWAEGQPAERTVLIPVDDAAAVVVTEHAERLASRFLRPRQDLELTRWLSDKLELARRCEELDVPTPRTVAPGTIEEAGRIARELGFPVVVKRIANRSQLDYDDPSVRIVHAADELERVWRDLDARGVSDNYLLQEFIPGGSESVWMFNGYFDDASRCLASYTGFKIRQYPADRGPTTLGECRWNPVVAELAERFLSGAGYRGIVDAGFRYDARDGGYKLLDVNPRIGATFRLFVTPSGTDVARALYLDLVGRPVPDDRPVDGRRWLVEPFDIRTSLGKPRSLRRWAGSLRGVRELAWFAPDDPLPAALMAVNLGGRAVAAAAASSGRSGSSPPEVGPEGTVQEAVDLHFESSAGYWADVYAGDRVESAVYQQRRDRALQSIERLGLSPGAAVLELGCGAGELAVRLARAGYAVTATDTVGAMLERTTRLAESESVPLDVRPADAHDLPFDDDAFDLVVGLGVLPWLHSPHRATAEIARVTRPGGYVLLTVDGARRLNELFDPWLTWPLSAARSSLRRRLDERAGGVNRPSYHRNRRDDVPALLADAGLEPISVQAVGFGPFTFYRRPAFSDRFGLALNARLQARADRGSQLLAAGGVHHLALARKRA